MILTDNQILEEMKKGTIIVRPFNKKYLGSNSYDIHLGDTLKIYNERTLDPKKENKTVTIKIPENGVVLYPKEIYLATTNEYTETHKHVPFLEGRSSVGRLGINIHSTAGKGDIGFCNHWTLEISVNRPVKIYPKMRIGQLIYFETKGEVLTPYNKKQTAKYTKINKDPQESMIWKDYINESEKEVKTKSHTSMN